MAKKPLGLYIHVPFCVKKCPYCSFYSIKATPALMDEYTNFVCKKLKEFSQQLNRTADTLYFGGGTPSILGTNRILKILETAQKYFTLDNTEITLEVNPATENELDFKELHASGINRLSVGLQSAHNNELSLLGRLHTAEDAHKTILLAQDSGFKNISVDLILAIQGQSEKSLLESIEFCDRLAIQHISAYMLSIEKGTEYYENRNTLDLKSENEQSSLYLLACSEFEKLGFHQYEISNFSKKGCESKHNLKYWNAEEYLGIGPSAHSFVDGKRFYFDSSIDTFFKNESPIIDGIGGTEEEYALLRLRLSQGLVNTEYQKRFFKNIPAQYFENAKKYEKYGLVKIQNNESLSFTPQGFLVSNKLISEIILS